MNEKDFKEMDMRLSKKIMEMPKEKLEENLIEAYEQNQKVKEIREKMVDFMRDLSLKELIHPFLFYLALKNIINAMEEAMPSLKAREEYIDEKLKRGGKRHSEAIKRLEEKARDLVKKKKGDEPNNDKTKVS